MLQLWDVGSSVGSLQMAANYLHGCDATLLVHDLSRQEVCVGANVRFHGNDKPMRQTHMLGTCRTVPLLHCLPAAGKPVLLLPYPYPLPRR